MNHQFINEIFFDWDKVDKLNYVRNIKAIKDVKRLTFTQPITFFVGENGSGKSTLLEAIAIAHGFNPEGGSKNYAFSTYDSHSDLYRAIRISKGHRREKWGYFFRAESFYNVATQEKEYERALSEGYHEISHGESFMALVKKNLRAEGLYILDEPEASLSPQRQLSFLMQIHESIKMGSQFLIVSHSPILLGIPGAEIYSFDENGIVSCAYEETESYRVTELFINNREVLLNKLLEEA